MAKIVDRFDPSFARWPLQNNRTGLQRVNIPLVLVVPFSRDPVTRMAIADSSVSNLKFFIEDAPGLVPVAGFQNAGIFVPDFERFTRHITAQELASVKIELSGLPFYDKSTGELKDFRDAVDGDLFEYTLIRGITDTTGPRDRIVYHPDADYYDLSPFTIDTAELKPYGIYKFSWQCNYFHRVTTPDGELFCIDKNDLRLARFSLPMSHPGEIHQMMIDNTPAVYFDGTPLENDNLVKFYRPFADALQDIFDEQSLLRGINFIEKIPAQFIPYLAYLIGWDLPFFPGSTDKIRRAVLRNARRLQQLKGSKRVIRELFELFGYTIDIVNLWYSRNGTKFIGPNEPQQDKDEEITIHNVCQTEVLIAGYDKDGFGRLEIPMLFKPDGDITIDAWLVENGSEAAAQMDDLLRIIDIDPEGLMSTVCPVGFGFIISQPLNDKITAPTVGHSRILVTQKFGAVDGIQIGDAPLSIYGVKYDHDRNILSITFDHYIKFDGRMRLYAFASYRRNKIVVPPKLSDLRSNRFDIQLFYNRFTGETPSTQLLEFLLDFIFKLKAFHSILRKIVFNVNIVDVYNVIDFCLSGDIVQAPSTDLGELQTLPPVIPSEPSCSGGTFKRGFKDADLLLRSEILNGLKAEHAAWKSLDGTRDIPPDIAPILQSLSRIVPNASTEAIYGNDGINYGVSIYGEQQHCEYTHHGQDRVIVDDSKSLIKDFDHTVDDRTKLCEDTIGNKLDNCFKGRVKQDVNATRYLSASEIISCNPCTLMGGNGFYYYNQIRGKTLGSVKYGNGYAFGRAEFGGGEIDTGDIRNLGRSRLTDMIIRTTANTEYVHFTANHALTQDDIFTNDNAAIQRPSLQIIKDNMFIPGHRFVTMGAMKDDFTHETYGFRPWDDQFNANNCTIAVDYVVYNSAEYGIFTYGDNAVHIDDLNPRIEIGTDGEERLIFNHIPYKVYGNGLEPDISSMSEHEDRGFLVTHTIFSSAPQQITGTDTIIDHSDGGISFTDFKSICFGNDYGPIFKSANKDCECDVTSSYVAGVTDVAGMDYIDGYPAEYGRYHIGSTVITWPFIGTDDELINALGLPVTNDSERPDTLLFKMGSGIRIDPPTPGFQFWMPYRLDCGCAFFECGDASSGMLRVDRCTLDDFNDENGLFEPDCDKVAINSVMQFIESYGTCGILMGKYPHSAADGYTPIPNMLVFNPTKISISNVRKFPSSGEFMFVDSAGIIHEGSFEYDGSRIDITTTTKDPRVWGEQHTGKVDGITVYRRGIVTTCRMILETTQTGSNVIASGCSQKIDLFKTTFGCVDKQPKDPFAFHLECGIIDGLEFEIACGPGFDSNNTIWCNIIEDSNGIWQPVSTDDQCLFWTDVWNNYESILTNCPSGTSATGSGSTT
ncbi:MAG: phage tail protein [Nitrososphaerales archaeon]